MIDQKKYIHFIELYRKDYPVLQREKQFRNGQELWLKVRKDQEQYEKTIIELKGRTGKFHKSSTIF